MSSRTFYVTTPIYYVTAKPHLGSLYSTVLADVAARWHAIMGEQTFMLTGTDEHGQKVAQAAHNAGMSPRPFVDQFIDAYKKIWSEYHIHYNRFIRTTDTYHIEAVQQWITQLIEKGDIYKDQYTGWYCTPCETFITEKDLSTLRDGEVPACPSCQRPTTWVSEEAYFFKLSAYQDKLLKFYQENPDFIVPCERAAEVINFVQSGLKDLSISRTTVTWGIPFPNDAQHVTYVWADALNNYITAVGYAQPDRANEFSQWWPAQLHVMGKDIVRFHAIYWPAFLMASGLSLPKQLLVHGWIKVNNQKMSKSFGNVVDPEKLLSEYGADPVRYYLVRQLAINQDAEFSIADLEQRITADLCNDLGNLVHRMSSLAQKYDVQNVTLNSENRDASSRELLDHIAEMVNLCKTALTEWSFHMAYAHVWKGIHQVNAYFHVHEPWKLAKNNPALFTEVLAVTCSALDTIAHCVWPIMPTVMDELLSSIGTTRRPGQFMHEIARQFIITHRAPLFTKPEEPVSDQNIPAAAAVADKKETENTISHIAIDQFAAVQLHVGTIRTCEYVPKSEKLLKLEVDFGALGVRQILSGIRAYYELAELLGKQGVFVTNLAPRKMAGLESQGMMLFVHDEQGKLVMATVARIVPNGERLG